MSRHISGDEAAMRVVSLYPPPANAWRSRSGMNRSWNVAMVFTIAKASTCGRWLTAPRTPSCSMGSISRIRAPQASQRRRTFASASGSVCEVGVRIHRASRNKSGLAASTPVFSLPAMGCMPTTRMPAGASAHALDQRAFDAPHVRHDGARSEPRGARAEHGFEGVHRRGEHEQIGSGRRLRQVRDVAVDGLQLDSPLEVLDPPAGADDGFDESLLLADHPERATDEAYADDGHLLEQREGARLGAAGAGGLDACH